MPFDLLTIWIAAGIVFLIGEMLTSSFFLFFIALGCFAAGLAASLGQPYFVQTLAFALVAIAGTVLLRKPIQQRLLKSININADVGREIKTDQAITPRGQARITYQGTSWQATNLGETEIAQGDRVVIVGIDGNTLLIRKVE